ncbi:hypothetical protein ACIPYS_28795 [Kitasatospora sp. NPDC089913]
MAARREKVARWESGRVVPDLATQRAMAELHAVPFAEVLRLGWPRWLPGRTADGAANHRSTRCGSATLSGASLAAYLRRLVARVTPAPMPAVPEGLAAQIHARVVAAEALRLDVGPTVLLSAVEGDLALVRTLLSRLDRSAADRPGVAAVHARTADLCGRLAAAVDDRGRAEAYLFEATRSTAPLGAAEFLAIQLSHLAGGRLRAGATQDARLLLRASRSVWPEPGPLRIVTGSREARMWAQLGERSAAIRSMERADAALAEQSADRRPTLAVIRDVDRNWLGVNKALTWLQLEEPRLAVREFDDVLVRDIPASPFRVPVWLLQPLVRAHIQVGDLDVAVWQVRRALDLFGWLPEPLTRQVKAQFAGHRRERIVRGLWADLGA